MAGLVRNRIGPGPELSSEQLSEIAYAPNWARPNQPAANDYASVKSPLTGRDYFVTQHNNGMNSALVNRQLPRDGIQYSYSYGLSPDVTPQLPTQVERSKFQPNKVALFDWILNMKWYIAYPAATVMNGGAHNLGLSEKTPQLSTRISGGPGSVGQIMGARPRYTKTQDIPRYPTDPAKYRTESAQG